MSPQIILTAIHGDLKGREFAFDGPATCVIGRCVDCQIRLPGDDWTVSRHHCRLEVDPPLIRVRDLGSLNGTYVNGEKIGQRDRALSPESASRVAQPVRELLDGDDLQVGDTRFLVEVVLTLPAECAGRPDDAEASAYLCVPGL